MLNCLNSSAIMNEPECQRISLEGISSNIKALEKMTNLIAF